MTPLAGCYNSHMATFTLYLPDSLLRRLDEYRGEETRSAFLRRMLEKAVDFAEGSLDPPSEKPARSPVVEKVLDDPGPPPEDLVALDPELERRRRIAATHKAGCKCLNCIA